MKDSGTYCHKNNVPLCHYDLDYEKIMCLKIFVHIRTAKICHFPTMVVVDKNKGLVGIVKFIVQGYTRNTGELLKTGEGKREGVWSDFWRVIKNRERREIGEIGFL